jgi:hypothetical protein
MEIAIKDPSFRGMLCFNRGDRTFLIRRRDAMRPAQRFGEPKRRIPD